MLDYRKCSEESYKRAMASKDKDIRPFRGSTYIYCIQNIKQMR